MSSRHHHLDRDADDHGGWLPPEPVRRPLRLTHPVISVHALVRMTLAAGVLVGSLLLLEARLIEGPPPGLDVAVLDWVAEHRTEAAVAVSRQLSRLGDLPVVLAVGAVLVVLARRRSGRWDSAWLVGTVVTGALGITALVKEITDRARPDGALVDALSFAFPSGHASRAAAVYALLAYLAIQWGGSRSSRVAMSALAILMGLATGVGRVVLGVHWPSDVLFGWLMGTIWLLVVIGSTRPHRMTDEEVAAARH